MMRLAFYQPEIPQNTGTLMRLSACLGIDLDIIHPCGFVWDDRRLRRAGMDYADQAPVHHHKSWMDFYEWTLGQNHRLILLDPRADIFYTDFTFHEKDILMVGQESCGVPEPVSDLIPNRVSIPMKPHCRSLNVAISAAMVLGEALRQTELFPKEAG
jgi:tRNA (cytidine/uridine-2'-O-)-methyltransferase